MLDGFPRSLEQAQNLDEKLRQSNEHLDAVISLRVPASIIIDRVKGFYFVFIFIYFFFFKKKLMKKLDSIDRWVHIGSGRVYNLKFNPPKVPGVDDITGEKLQQRPDDNEVHFISFYFLCFKKKKKNSFIGSSSVKIRKIRESH